jgi:hypothetical protein
MTIALANQVSLDRHRKDPLYYFRCKSLGQERVARHFIDGVEVYAHAAERSGKSKIGAALTAAFCLGKDRIAARDGETIAVPVLKPPVRWVMGFDSYKLGGAAVMNSLRGMLGTYGEDFTEELAGGASGCPSVVRVRHHQARKEADWSTIYVFPYDGVRPRSMELDGWWCDEPPPVMYLEALRSRIGALRMLRGVITATPLERKVWFPIKEQYPADEDRVEAGRVRIRWSVFDNEALPEGVQEELRQRAKGSAYENAKLYGHHVDATGGNPWAVELLDRWEAKTRRGTLVRVKVTDEEDKPDGREKHEVSRVVEFWEKVDPAGSYLVTSDASSGTKSPLHDPAGIHVWERGSRTLVARYGQIGGLDDKWNGYVGPYGLGCITAWLAAEYSVGGRPALVAPEANAWSNASLTALRDMGHRRILHDRHVHTPGHESVRLGFANNKETRPLFITAFEQALARDDVKIYSPDVVRSLRDCIIDSSGKIVAGDGYHDEDLILAGAALHIISTRQTPRPEAQKTDTERFAEMVEKEFKVHIPASVKRGVNSPPQERW